MALSTRHFKASDYGPGVSGAAKETVTLDQSYGTGFTSGRIGAGSAHETKGFELRTPESRAAGLKGWQSWSEAGRTEGFPSPRVGS